MDDRDVATAWMPNDGQLNLDHAPTAEELVLSILADHLELEPGQLKPSHRFKDLGVTPLALVLVSLDLEEFEGTVLPYEELETVKTVAGLIRLVEQSR